MHLQTEYSFGLGWRSNCCCCGQNYTPRWPFSLKNLNHSLQLGQSSNLVAVVVEKDVDLEGGDLQLDALNQRLKSCGKKCGSQWAALAQACGTENGGAAELEEGGLSVASDCPW